LGLRKHSPEEAHETEVDGAEGILKRESPPSVLNYETRRSARGPTAHKLTVLEIVFVACGIIAMLAVIVGLLAAYFFPD
jgi:hypothetical protein